MGDIWLRADISELELGIYYARCPKFAGRDARMADVLAVFRPLAADRSCLVEARLDPGHLKHCEMKGIKSSTICETSTQSHSAACSRQRTGKALYGQLKAT